MGAKAKITQSEWLQALEEVRPSVQPAGTKTFLELLEVWKVARSQGHNLVAKLERAGRLERVRLATGKTFYRLIKP